MDTHWSRKWFTKTSKKQAPPCGAGSRAVTERQRLSSMHSILLLSVPTRALLIGAEDASIKNNMTTTALQSITSCHLSQNSRVLWQGLLYRLLLKGFIQNLTIEKIIPKSMGRSFFLEKIVKMNRSAKMATSKIQCRLMNITKMIN